MGGGGSSLRQEILNNVHYNQTTEFFQRTFSSSTTRVQTVNGIRVVLRAGTAGASDNEMIINGGINIDQTNGVTVDVININEASLTLDELTELQTALKADTEVTQNQLNEDFGGFIGAIGNGNNAATTFRNEVLNVIQTEIDQESVATTVNDVVNMNEVQLEITTPGDMTINGGINITQSIVIDVMSRTMVNNVIEAALNRQSVIDILNESTVLQTQKNTGIATIAQRIGEWFRSPGFWVVLLIIGVIIGLVIWFKFFKGKGGKGGGRRQKQNDYQNPPVQLPPQQFQQLQQLQQQQMAAAGPQPGQNFIQSQGAAYAATDQLFGNSPNPSARASPKNKSAKSVQKGFSPRKAGKAASGSPAKGSAQKAVAESFKNANQIARAAPVSENARKQSATNRASARANVQAAQAARAAAPPASPKKAASPQKATKQKKAG